MQYSLCEAETRWFVVWSDLVQTQLPCEGGGAGGAVVLRLVMGVLLVILLVCWACYEAEGHEEVKVELGQNVTLNCSLDALNIFWYMEIHSHFRGCIARTINEADHQYFVNTSGTKYVVMQANRLLITNVTAEDCRLYFCGRRQEDRISFKETFHVFSDVPIPPSTREPQQMGRKWPESVTYISLALNAVLVLTGLVLTVLCVKRNRLRPQDDPSHLASENPDSPEALQYEEIQLPYQRVAPAARAPPECIYYKAQLPGPTPRPIVKT